VARGKYSFNRLVAFGDEFSDNGNGGFAHGITGSPATVYCFGTWTNGPVAVSYLADLLKMPLRDLAFADGVVEAALGQPSIRPTRNPQLDLLVSPNRLRTTQAVGTRMLSTQWHISGLDKMT